MAIKMSKKAASIDMTAMCDVAFLLLTFFILTATAKVPEALPVDAPASTALDKLSEKDLAIISVGENKVFYDLKGKDVRERTLELMGQKYNVEFTPEESAVFSTMGSVGVPVESLKQLIAMKPADRIKKGVQPGIPRDSLNNQLKEWVYNSRIANIEVDKEELKIAIKGDAKEEYPLIHRVMDILQDQNINTFALITGLKKEN